MCQPHPHAHATALSVISPSQLGQIFIGAPFADLPPRLLPQFSPPALVLVLLGDAVSLGLAVDFSFLCGCCCVPLPLLQRCPPPSLGAARLLFCSVASLLRFWSWSATHPADASFSSASPTAAASACGKGAAGEMRAPTVCIAYPHASSSSSSG